MPDRGAGSGPPDIVEDEEPRSGAIYELRESHGDRVRRFFVYGLVILIGMIAVGSGIAICLGVGRPEDIFEYLNRVFVPLVALSGGPIGFYFADKNSRRD